MFPEEYRPSKLWSWRRRQARLRSPAPVASRMLFVTVEVAVNEAVTSVLKPTPNALGEYILPLLIVLSPTT